MYILQQVRRDILIRLPICVPLTALRLPSQMNTTCCVLYFLDYVEDIYDGGIPLTILFIYLAVRSLKDDRCVPIVSLTQVLLV